MLFNWRPYAGIDTPGDLPPTHRCVLVAFGGGPRGVSESVVVGYLKYGAGDKGSPYWVTPGFDRGERAVTHWADVLPDDFAFPGRDVMVRSPGKTPARIAWEHQQLVHGLVDLIDEQDCKLGNLKEFLAFVEKGEG